MPLQHPPDGGAMYTETNLHHFFPEPWNMITSALFLIPALYWIIKLKGFNRQYKFLSIASWILLIGCIGGTIYHGLRRWRIFLFMDWLPIAILCLLASIYFWAKVTGKWIWGILAFLIFIGLEALIRNSFHYTNVQIMISLNYAVMVLLVLLPLILLLIRMHGHNLGLVLLALLSFAVALFFRVIDQWAPISIGTHFLWHLFGVEATSLIFIFIYRLKDFKA